MQASYLLINNFRTHYLLWNAESAGRPVILLHGLAEGARLWQKVAPLLAQAGYRVLAPDLRGHGLTDNTEDEPRLDDFLFDAAGFIEAAQIERPLLVGHGLGATIALEFGARVSIGPRSPAGLVLIEGGINSTESMLLNLIKPINGLTVDSFILKLHNLQSKWMPDEQDLQILLSYFEIDNDETLLPRLTLEQEERIRLELREHPALERLVRLRCPILGLSARPPAPLTEQEQTELAQKEKNLAEAQQKNAQLQVRWIKDCVHEAPLHKPEELGQTLLDFFNVLPD